MKNFWFIINKIGSNEMESIMMEKLGELKNRVIGKVSYDPELVQRELTGGSLTTDNPHKDIKQIIKGLEKFVFDNKPVS